MLRMGKVQGHDNGVVRILNVLNVHNLILIMKALICKTCTNQKQFEHKGKQYSVSTFNSKLLKCLLW